MGYLVFMLIAVALFSGFLFLTYYEARRGVRVFAAFRNDLDAQVARAIAIVTHVDFEPLVRQQFQLLAAHVANDIAHLFLRTVRAIEHVLTRLVRHLRARHGITEGPNATPRAFVKTMREFKRELSSTRPPISEV